MRGGGVKEIFLLGGEPLLHTKIAEVLGICRKFFPQTSIKILSNGVCLHAIGDEFWKSCADNNIEIAVTKYPLLLPFEEIESKAEKEHVLLTYYNHSGDVEKTLYKEPLDLQGKQNYKDSFYCCPRAFCYTLKNGKLYHCTLIPSIDNFARYYNKDFCVDESDYVDIYKVESKSEVLKKLASPGRFCRYCDIGHNEFGLKWEKSRKDINEWIR